MTQPTTPAKKLRDAGAMSVQPDSPGQRPNRSLGSRLLNWMGWPIRMLLQGLILGYQRFISPLFGSSCRYHPSCSGYALVAIRRHGAFKGSVLAGWRVLKCNPWSGGGVDPVPRRGRWLPSVKPDGTPRNQTGETLNEIPQSRQD